MTTSSSPVRGAQPHVATLRRALAVVAIANVGYFSVESTVAKRIASVSLFADSIDFLEDAAVNFLIVAALGRASRTRARVGMALSGVLLVPALAFLWTAWQKFHSPAAPEPWLLSCRRPRLILENAPIATELVDGIAHATALKPIA